MQLQDVEIHHANTLEEASEFLGCYAPSSRIIAGGTDLLVDLKTDRTAVSHLVSINRIPGLRDIQSCSNGLRIGALVTLSELCNADELQHSDYAPIFDSVSQMAAMQIRNLATVGGNIANAVPCADLPPIFTVMNAEAVIWANGKTRNVALDSFFQGPRSTILNEKEILIAIQIPKPVSRFGAAYQRFSLREGNSIAVAAVAASLVLHEDGTIENARVALGAVAPIPKLVDSITDLLASRNLDDTAIVEAASAAANAAEPIADIRGSVEFRRSIIHTLTVRALQAAYTRCQEVKS